MVYYVSFLVVNKGALSRKRIRRCGRDFLLFPASSISSSSSSQEISLHNRQAHMRLGSPGIMIVYTHVVPQDNNKRLYMGLVCTMVHLWWKRTREAVVARYTSVCNIQYTSSFSCRNQASLLYFLFERVLFNFSDWTKARFCYINKLEYIYDLVCNFFCSLVLSGYIINRLSLSSVTIFSSWVI